MTVIPHWSSINSRTWIPFKIFKPTWKQTQKALCSLQWRCMMKGFFPTLVPFGKEQGASSMLPLQSKEQRFHRAMWAAGRTSVTALWNADWPTQLWPSELLWSRHLWEWGKLLWKLILQSFKKKQNPLILEFKCKSHSNTELSCVFTIPFHSLLSKPFTNIS